MSASGRPLTDRECGAIVALSKAIRQDCHDYGIDQPSHRLNYWRDKRLLGAADLRRSTPGTLHVICARLLLPPSVADGWVTAHPDALASEG